ncbi:MAG TPA: tripartite tricarboxylate transporter substrate binding protein [Burkholderiales bacterium]
MIVRALVALLLAGFAAATLAQEPYPSKPITMVVAFPPGGVADLTARPTANVLQKIFKQPVVILNKPGAGGSIGTASVTSAKPDGYTLLMALSSVSTNPEADRVAGRPASFELKQLEPIALVSADPTVFMVRADSPYKTLKDVVADAKKRPGAINYASSGNYGTYHVATEMFSHAAGIKMNHIPYSGGGPALTAILGGQVDLAMFGPSVAIAQVKAGKLRPLATLSGKRLESMPDVPTLKEVGYDVEYYIWSGLFAPAGTPEPVLKTLREAMRQVVNDPEFKASMAKIETPIAYLDAPAFRKYFERDAQRLTEVVRRIGKIE